MSQRDRLAAAIHENRDALFMAGSPADCAAIADALLARGVRIIDEETLARALPKAHFTLSPGASIARFPSHWATEYARSILAALDAGDEIVEVKNE